MLARWGCENELRKMNKTSNSISCCVCHSHHSLSFYFCKMQHKVKPKPGWRPHLPLDFDKAAFNKSTGRSGFCCRDLPPPFELWSDGKSSENVFPPARVLLHCFKETVRLASDALLTFYVCLPTKVSKTPALHTQSLNSSNSCQCRTACDSPVEQWLKDHV